MWLIKTALARGGPRLIYANPSPTIPHGNPPLTSLLRAPSTYPFPHKFRPAKYWLWRYTPKWRALLFQYPSLCIYIYIYNPGPESGRSLNERKLSILGEHQQRDNSWFILLVYEVGNSCSNRVIGDITNWSGCHSYKL